MLQAAAKAYSDQVMRCGLCGKTLILSIPPPLSLTLTLILTLIFLNSQLIMMAIGCGREEFPTLRS